jgi:hypothetical protein
MLLTLQKVLELPLKAERNLAINKKNQKVTIGYKHFQLELRLKSHGEVFKKKEHEQS